ncbi:hypothetical protein [Streptosporangium saharense]|uniref:Uncharacterized protein n=1 Tax=Streptosporangium saharense TaxID=1706840 RepID=A0A7W7VRL9_9ACTN|nr:hypothetical protein [Streptosporangium saharense]MBB4919843.1 hypothetical protein [Streptosporangium saharense]
MRGEHEPTRTRRPRATPRGRHPYDNPPPPAPVAPVPYGTAGDPFSYGDWVGLDLTALRTRRRRPSEPEPWSWRELPRDRLLRSALLIGFLAAAGVGVWTSGWAPPYWPQGIRAAVPTPAATTETSEPPRVVEASATPAAVPVPTVTAAPGRPPAEKERPRKVTRERDTTPPRDPVRTVAPPEERPTMTRPTRTTRAAGRERRQRHALRRANSWGRGHTGADRRGARSRTQDGRTNEPPAPQPRPSPGAVGAAYACRHLSPGDWRYGYCVTAWNEYRRRTGSP